MANTTEEILQQFDPVKVNGEWEWVLNREQAAQAMEEYAKQKQIQLIENLRRKPVDVYSEKIRGQDKVYYLGEQWINKMIAALKK